MTHSSAAEFVYVRTRWRWPIESRTATARKAGERSGREEEDDGEGACEGQSRTRRGLWSEGGVLTLAPNEADGDAQGMFFGIGQLASSKVGSGTNATMPLQCPAHGKDWACGSVDPIFLGSVNLF